MQTSLEALAPFTCTFSRRLELQNSCKIEFYFFFRYENQVRHIRVEKNTESYYYLGDTKYFSSVPVSTKVKGWHKIKYFQFVHVNTKVKVNVRKGQRLVSNWNWYVSGWNMFYFISWLKKRKYCLVMYL
jgi:hypothetical protein